MRLILAGGALMFLSAFFRYAYGPWGAEISVYSMISWNLRWESWYIWLSAWPAALGLFQASCAALSFILPERIAERCRWLSSACLLGAVALTYLAAFAVNGSSVLWRETAVRAALAEPVVILCTMIILVALRRPQWVTFVGVVWTVKGMYPISESVPLSDVFLIYGMGYWMLLGGAVMVAMGSVRQIWSVSRPSPADTAGRPTGGGGGEVGAEVNLV